MIVETDARVGGAIDRDGVRVGYQVFGEGPRGLLLLPTWPIVHSDFWRLQVPHLARRYTVVVYDGRGNGASFEGDKRPDAGMPEVERDPDGPRQHEGEDEEAHRRHAREPRHHPSGFIGGTGSDACGAGDIVHIGASQPMSLVS